MIITSRLFQAFLECPTKCFLWAQGEQCPGNPYVDWVRNQLESYRDDGITQLTETAVQNGLSIGSFDAGDFRNAKWQLSTNLVARTPNLESVIHAVQRIPSHGLGKPACLIPIRFVLADKLTQYDKLTLAFDALILSEVLGCKVETGRIIHGNGHASIMVKVSSLADEVRKRINQITALILSHSYPDLVLNRRCAECEFQERCRQKAIEKDDLCLLSAMSEKERKKFNSKGIFTITQLSYTFRPRRRPKHLAGKRDKYRHSLRALAIREGKIHIVGSPTLKIEGTPVYLDVEGLPDGSFYYLIGIRIKTPERIMHHCLWADNPGDEESIWTAFQSILSGIDKPALIHYGSFETTFFKRMCKRYGIPPNDSRTATAIKSSLNLLSSIFAQFYFPTYTNGLKDIARYLTLVQNGFSKFDQFDGVTG